MIKKNYGLSIATIVFSLFFLYHAVQIQEIGSSFHISSRTWPVVLLVSMLALGIVMLIRTYNQSKKLDSGEPLVIEEIETVEVAEAEEIRRFNGVPMSVISAVVVWVYFFLMSRLGFVISTILFIPLFAFLLGNKKHLKSFILGLIITAVFVYIFTQLLTISLPRGIGIFHDISLMFY